MQVVNSTMKNQDIVLLSLHDLKLDLKAESLP